MTIGGERPPPHGFRSTEALMSDAARPNYARIKSAVFSIEESEAALKWLLEYGVNIPERGEEIGVTVSPNSASALAGAKEAGRVLSAYARFEIPRVVEIAIRSCRNTIEIEKSVILAEMSKTV